MCRRPLLIVLVALTSLGAECDPLFTQPIPGLLGHVRYDMAGLNECEFLCIPQAVEAGRGFRYRVYDVDVEVTVTSSDPTIVTVLDYTPSSSVDGGWSYSISMWAQSPGTVQIQLWDGPRLVDVLEATVAEDGLQ